MLLQYYNFKRVGWGHTTTWDGQSKSIQGHVRYGRPAPSRPVPPRPARSRPADPGPASLTRPGASLVRPAFSAAAQRTNHSPSLRLVPFWRLPSAKMAPSRKLPKL